MLEKYNCISVLKYTLTFCKQLLQAQYVFIHKAMLDVVDSLSTFKGGNQFISSGAYPSLYVNRKSDVNLYDCLCAALYVYYMLVVT